MNIKKIVLSVVSLSVIWFGMDFLIHGILLMDQYKATANLWRPMDEMNHVVSIASTVIYATLFTLFYIYVSGAKTVSAGMRFGIWYGLISGFAMFGTSMYMPIPMTITGAWFLACLVESVVGGAVMGYLTKEP